MTPKAGDHSWEKQVELIILLFSVSSPFFWLTWTQCEICPGGWTGVGGGSELTPSCQWKYRAERGEKEPQAASPGWRCCEKLAERSSLIEESSATCAWLSSRASLLPPDGWPGSYFQGDALSTFHPSFPPVANLVPPPFGEMESRGWAEL